LLQYNFTEKSSCYNITLSLLIVFRINTEENVLIKKVKDNNKILKR